ncbi:hypothetical protein MTO96_048746 [Rhipicephalus appendiculatus]
MDDGIFKEKIDIATPDSTALQCATGRKKGAAPASVRKRLTAASRLPRLPTEHFRVIVRPRGGLDIKKTGLFQNHTGPHFGGRTNVRRGGGGCHLPEYYSEHHGG